MRIISAFLLAICVSTSEAGAQTSPIVSLAVPQPALWDVTGFAGSRGINAPARPLDATQWTYVGAFSASLGRQWTPHIKTDLDIAATPEARQFVQSTVNTADALTLRFGQRYFSTASLTGSLLYQFGENAWFHPFVGGGVDTTRDRSRLMLQEQFACVRPPCTIIALPAQLDVSYETRPFLTSGFKWYVSERAFVRGDIKSLWSSSRAEGIVWRIGIGVDF